MSDDVIVLDDMISRDIANPLNGLCAWNMA
jgi:hypothetical protein